MLSIDSRTVPSYLPNGSLQGLSCLFRFNLDLYISIHYILYNKRFYPEWASHSWMSSRMPCTLRLCNFTEKLIKQEVIKVSAHTLETAGAFCLETQASVTQLLHISSSSLSGSGVSFLLPQQQQSRCYLSTLRWRKNTDFFVKKCSSWLLQLRRKR